MFKRSLTILIFIFSFLSFSLPTFAHVLKTDHSIGALLHIDPDDNPVANQIAYFYFDFKDTSGKFDATKCLCQAKVLENGSVLASQSLTTTSDSGSFSFTFPEKGVYTIKLAGQSSSGDFPNFNLSYDVRVDRGLNKNLTLPLHLEHYVGIGIILSVFLLFFILGTIRKLRK